MMTSEELEKMKVEAQERFVGRLGGEGAALVAELWDAAERWAWENDALISRLQDDEAWRECLAVPDLLRDMRLVYQAGGAGGQTPAEKQLCKMFKEDPRGFLEQMQRLEIQYKLSIARKDKLDELVKRGLAKEREKEGRGKEEDDLGTGKALELCDKLLHEYHAQKGK